MNLIKKIIKKKMLLAIIIIIIAISGYFGYKKIFTTATVTKYILSPVKKGTIVVSVSGTGQVATLDQIDLKSKASGDLIALNITEGQEIKAGDLIAQINAKDALKTVRDAQINLESAKLSLKKTLAPTDSLSILQAENSLANAEQSKIQAQDDLKKAYDDAFTAVANAFLELPTVITGLHDVLYNTTYNTNQSNINYYTDLVSNYYQNENTITTFKNSAENTYNTAKSAYDKNFNDYRSTNRYAEPEAITSLLNETYNTTKAIAEAVKNADNFFSFAKDKLSDKTSNLPAYLNSHQTSIGSYTSKINTHIASLLAIKNTIKNSNDSIASIELTINEKTESLKDLKAGTDALDIESSQLTVKQRENSLRDAQSALADYTLRAPFDGIIASVSAKKNDSVSSGTIIGTLMTKQKVVEVSLNEVDVAKIKVGQKASMTFDAIEDLEMTGKVVQIDSIGTVSSGVVSYTVKIAFDTQNDNVKPGMSVSASIITETKTDILLISSSAIKTKNGQNYVQTIPNPLTTTTQDETTTVTSAESPTQKAITLGIADDTNSEVINGLNQGDKIVTQTITETSTAKSQTSVFSLFGMGGGNRTQSSSSKSTTGSSTNKNSASSGSTQAGGPPPGF